MSAAPLVLTCGEPAGVASEITAKAWSALKDDDNFCFFLMGDAEDFAARTKQASYIIPHRKIPSPKEAAKVFNEALPILHIPLATPSRAGTLDGRNAAYVIQTIASATNICMSGTASGMVTNPIQKETLYGVGFEHQGHTDYLASLVREKGHVVHEVMMLAAAGLRTVPVTVHIPLQKVPAALTQDAIVQQGTVVHDALRRHFGISEPRIAVTGLNPHAGENGNLGTEEKTIVIPAITALQAKGIQAFGPLSADTAFHAEARATYDAILCMYHDQALIPVKMLDFHGGVNVTLGLPFIRTSPDHGTALSLAGKGVARPDSLIAAIKLAAQMAARA